MANVRAGQHTSAQSLAAVQLCASGIDPEAVSAAVGAATRTLRHWAKRAKDGALRADPAAVEVALGEYASLLGEQALRPLPKIGFDSNVNPKPERAVLPDTPSAWRAFESRPEPPNTPQPSDVEPEDSEDSPRGAVSKADRLPPVHVQAPPSDLNPDVQQLASSYGPQAVWHLAALARAMSENRRLPGWQLEQFKVAAGIWSKLAALAAPAPKAAEYVPPKAAQAVPKKVGEALVFLGDLVGQVNDPRELEALEGLIRKLGSGEIQPEPPSASVQ